MLTRAIGIGFAFTVGFAFAAVFAGEAPESLDCLAAGADYFPGVDAQGRKVEPAAVEPPVEAGLASITVLPEVRTPRNRQLDETTVAIDLYGLDEALRAPRCPPVEEAVQETRPDSPRN